MNNDYAGHRDHRAYIRLAAMLRERISNGTIGPGQAVPSITRLTREYGHARQTVAKAMHLLQDEGLLTYVPGLGYFVALAQVWRRHGDAGSVATGAEVVRSP